MGSNYLANVTDGFGLPSDLPDGVAAQASSLIDAYLKRPKGLVYTVDANGAPCSMAAAVPEFTFKLASGISAGSSVVATVTPAIIRSDMVGEVVILDNASNTLREACVITATSGNNQITLGTVQFAHGSSATVQTGLVLAEDRNAPSKRSIIRVTEGPIVNVLSLLGRYAYGRRSDQVGGLYQEMNLLAAVQTFGGPPEWIPIPVAQCSWSTSTQELWVPAGLLMAYYSDVRARYIAGFPSSSLPDPLIRATVNVANALVSAGDALLGQLKSVAVGTTKFDRFIASAMDEDTKSMLAPFKALTMF